MYCIQPNYPAGKLPGKPEFANKYFNMSVGEGDAQGPWNGENFEQVNASEEQLAVDGEGTFSVKLNAQEMKTMEAMSARLQSNIEVNPMTGAELGMTEDVARIIGAANGGEAQTKKPGKSPPRSGKSLS